MTILEIILCIFLLCMGTAALTSVIQGIVCERKREKREADREARDQEYHEMRMKEFKQ